VSPASPAGPGDPSTTGVVREIYETLPALQRGDPLPDLFASDIEWDTSAAPTGTAGRGIEEAVADMTGMLEAFTDYEIEIERLVDAGEGVVVGVIRNRGRGAASGVPIEGRRAHVWRIRDGRAVAMRLYLDPDEALAATGVD
jgi:uncharacterized protein